jgi:hypothetical protein
MTGHAGPGDMQGDVQIAILRMIRESGQLDRAVVMRQVPGAGQRDVVRALHLLTQDRAIIAGDDRVLVTDVGLVWLSNHELRADLLTGAASGPGGWRGLLRRLSRP